MTALQTAVLDLADARDFAFAGGKAVNLAELLGAGFPVPDGFCVGTPAYAQAADTAGIAALLDAPDLPVRARDALLATPIPDDVAAAVTAAYLALGEAVPVAVRSSATAEDLPGASFAGQQDTYLNVVGVDAVLDAVRRCWASLWTDRAVAYRADAGIPHAGIQLAVVVQRMVDAQAAGVLFTADPVSGRRSRSVLDAAPGLGEAVVSGAVDPDHCVVDRRPAGSSRSGRRRGRDGLPRPTRRCASAASTLGRRVEAHFGAPQDIEWALDGDGALWLTQSRADHHALPGAAAARRPGLRVYLCVSLPRACTRPITPMGLSAFRVVRRLARRARRTGGPSTRCRARRASAIAGERVVRRPHRRRCAARSGARPCPPDARRDGGALGGGRPRAARRAARSRVTRRSPAGRSPGPSCGSCSATGCPRSSRWPWCARPPPAPGRRARRPAARRASPRRHAATAARNGSTHARSDCSLGACPAVMPRTRARRRRRASLALGLARRLLAAADLDAEAVHERAARRCRTTSPPRWTCALWALADAAARRRVGAPPLHAAHARRAGRAVPRRHAAAACCSAGWRAFLAEHGHRAVGRDRPRHAALVRRPDPRARGRWPTTCGSTTRPSTPTPGSPGARPRPRRPSRRSSARVRRRSRVRACGRRPGAAPDAAARRACARRTRTTSCGCSPTPGPSSRSVGAELAGRGLLATADDVFFLELREVAAALDGADQRALGRARAARDTTGSCGAATSPGSCCPTAPSPRR